LATRMLWLGTQGQRFPGSPELVNRGPRTLHLGDRRTPPLSSPLAARGDSHPASRLWHPAAARTTGGSQARNQHPHLFHRTVNRNLGCRAGPAVKQTRYLITILRCATPRRANNAAMSFRARASAVAVRVLQSRWFSEKKGPADPVCSTHRGPYKSRVRWSDRCIKSKQSGAPA